MFWSMTERKTDWNCHWFTYSSGLHYDSVL